MSRYKNRIIEEVKNGNKKSIYSSLRRLGVRPGETSDNTFTLPTHANLSAQECAELMADHFSLISQCYEPIEMNNFFLKCCITQTIELARDTNLIGAEPPF